MYYQKAMMPMKHDNSVMYSICKSKNYLVPWEN